MKNFEHINTITLAETTNIISCNADKNGEPFQLKEVAFFLNFKPHSTDASTNMYLYPLVTVDPNISTFTDDLKFSTESIKINATTDCEIAEYCKIIDIEGTSDTDRMIILNKKQSTDVITIPDSRKGFCMVGMRIVDSPWGWTATYPFGVGTTLDIYGVRA